MWQDEWVRIEGRIDGLGQALTLAGAAKVFNPFDFLLDDLTDVLQTLRSFEGTFGDQLPDSARQRIVALTGRIETDLKRYDHHTEMKVTAGVPLLLSLRGQLRYLLNDIETKGRSLVLRSNASSTAAHRCRPQYR